MPKRILTKKGLQFIKWLLDRITRYLVAIVIVILVLIAAYFIHKTGILDEELKFSKAPKAGQYRQVDIDYLRGEFKYSLIDAQTKEVITTEVHEGARKTTIKQFPDGTAKVRTKNKGLTLEPGISIATGESLRLGGDLVFAYWKRWSLLGGVTAPTQTRSVRRLRGHLGLAYNPANRWFPNTSMFAGIDSSKSPVVGVRTRF